MFYPVMKSVIKNNLYGGQYLCKLTDIFLRIFNGRIYRFFNKGIVDPKSENYVWSIQYISGKHGSISDTVSLHK